MKVSYIEEDERNTELRAIFCKTDAIIPAVKIHSAAISTWTKVKEKEEKNTWMKIAIIPSSQKKNMKNDGHQNERKKTA